MKRLMVAVLALAAVSGVAVHPQPDWLVGLVAELEAIEGDLEEALYYCALAVLAPTAEDQRLFAQRVVNILEGSEGPHFDPRVATTEEEVPGAIVRLRALIVAVPEEGGNPEARAELKFALKNTTAFLALALEAALRGARSRKLLPGALHMRQAYAFLFTALGAEGSPTYLGGVRSLLRRLAPLVESHSSPGP